MFPKLDSYYSSPAVRLKTKGLVCLRPSTLHQFHFFSGQDLDTLPSLTQLKMRRMDVLNIVWPF